MNHTNPAPDGQMAPPQYQQQPSYTYAPVAQPIYRVAAPTNGLATASLTLGILAVVLAWVPFVGIILGIIGLALGVPALVKANASGVGKTVSIWGLSLSGTGLLLFVFFVAALG